MDSKETEKQFNFSLIEFVKANEVLYDPKHRDNRDNNVKAAIFKKFAEENGLECEFVMRRWCNLRNSYQRIKRETRHMPNSDGQQKTGKVWVYWDSLKFLETLGTNFYSNRSDQPEIKRQRTSAHRVHSNGKTDEVMFTQTLETYPDELCTDDDGTQMTNNSVNASDLLHLNSNILNSINDLSSSIKDFVTNQATIKSENDMSNDKITLYLNSLRPLLEHFSSEPLKFAKIQLKINQLLVDEIERDQSFI